jgi:hypothetical protein
MARIIVNMASPELDVCPECKNLIFKSEGAWLDVSLAGAYYADTSNKHAHQPAQEAHNAL